jgi:hypothetical protein
MKRVASMVSMAAILLFLVAVGVRHAAHESDGSRGQAVQTASRENAVSHALLVSTSTGSTRDSDETLPAAQTAPEVSSELIVRDADAAAKAWWMRAQRVTAAKEAKEFGADNAGLLRLPIDEAWNALKARSEGDARAMLLMNYLSGICEAERTYRRTPLKPDFLAGLPEGWAPFIDRLHEMQADTHEARVSRCDGVGRESLRAFLLDHIDRLLSDDSPETRLALANDNPNDSEAIADLRELARETPGTQADRMLGSRLLRSVDSSQQSEGRAILERLAPDDPTVAIELAYCLTEGCDHFAANPSAAMPSIEIAAGLGEQPGFYMMAKALDASNDAAGAWAWSNYALSLALAGCFETAVPTYIYVANAAVDEARRRHSLNAAQHNAGLAEFYAISGRWQRKAMERLSCGE